MVIINAWWSDMVSRWSTFIGNLPLAELMKNSNQLDEEFGYELVWLHDFGI